MANGDIKWKVIAIVLVVVIIGLVTLLGAWDALIQFVKSYPGGFLLGGAIIGLVVYLLMLGIKQLQTPMSLRETISRFHWAMPEESGFDSIGGVPMFDSMGCDHFQKGDFIAYRGPMFSSKGDYATWVLIIDCRLRDPSRQNSSIKYKMRTWKSEQEIFKLIDNLASPVGQTQGVEVIKKQIERGEELKKAVEGE